MHDRMCRSCYTTLAVLATLLAAPGARAAACGPADGPECVAVAACIGDSGLHFLGRATGAGRGTVEGRLSSGAGCRGTWEAARDGTTGNARFACDDGRRGQAGFVWQDPASGTTLGVGLTDAGEEIRLWSGRDLRAFLVRETGDPEGRMPCGPLAVTVD